MALPEILNFQLCALHFCMLNLCLHFNPNKVGASNIKGEHMELNFDHPTLQILKTHKWFPLFFLLPTPLTFYNFLALSHTF